jgi:diguanylate cyclase (GGDEF)-like protein
MSSAAETDRQPSLRWRLLATAALLFIVVMAAATHFAGAGVLLSSLSGALIAGAFVAVRFGGAEATRRAPRSGREAERVTRALRTLTAGNRTLLREKKEESLLSAMCRVAVEQAGYRLAFVNYAEQDEKRSVRTVARAGRDDGYIDDLNLTWAEEDRGRGSVGTAIRTGNTIVIRSIASDPRCAPWRDAALTRGFASVASFPLKVDGAVVGTFTLIAGEEHAFDDDEVELLDEMAADLSFGIEAIRADLKRKEAEAIARRALTHDALVELPNRSTFIRMVTAAVDDARRGKAPVAVLAIHVGRLQEIFDSFGYDAYSAILKEIAARLGTVPVCENALARLPMEEFGVLVATKDVNILGVIADRLLETFKAQFSIAEVRLDIRAAVGVSFYPEHGEQAESLIRRASLGAREAFKKDVSFRIYSGTGERERQERLALAGDLRAAIHAEQLTLHYQPKVRVEDGTLVGREALVRWHHPAKGDITPAVLVPLAEQMGLMGFMTNSVIRMAVRQLSQWKGKATCLPIAVNVSARNLYDPRLLTLVERWLRSFEVPAQLLQFEITESALVEQPEIARQTLKDLRALGSTIYIDDFGTGYSSLSYLATLPVNSLKIDGSFIRQIASSKEAYSVVSSNISMARNLDMGVVAEGVETPEQLAALKDLRCDEAQGYLFGKPLPPEEL